MNPLLQLVLSLSLGGSLMALLVLGLAERTGASRMTLVLRSRLAAEGTACMDRAVQALRPKTVMPT